MRIPNNNQKETTLHFNAIKIARTRNVVKNVETTIDLYELNPIHDKIFLNQLKDKIKVKTLMPNLPIQAYSRWQEIFTYAVENALDIDKQSILAVTQNKPCGILVFSPNPKEFHLDCICTWPIEYGKKVTLAGTTLFNQVFKKFINSRAKKINLEAIQNGPYDTVSKYKKLGFVECGNKDNEILMETNTPTVKQILETLNQIIESKELTNQKYEKLHRKFRY